MWSESETEEYISKFFILLPGMIPSTFNEFICVFFVALDTVKQILPLFSSDDSSILTKEVIIERIFQVFDTDNNGSIDFKVKNGKANITNNFSITNFNNN